ncbi:hypothetical protein BT63DRAFT_98329 [Microthyrium microscopicum]|uniref:Uncharacterized protein n=1 Tax=Microthyrium microscopicum TaxID=703497 RepID=A0A6A6TZQ0_9PEZI|nr:hypothetical protein BT63DRAFT_98329 [Microthyrium microscopicum]
MDGRSSPDDSLRFQSALVYSLALIWEGVARGQPRTLKFHPPPDYLALIYLPHAITPSTTSKICLEVPLEYTRKAIS